MSGLWVLTLAAARLGTTQATVSRRVARLEQGLGVQLLIRQSNGCALTEECQSMLPVFEEIEAGFSSVATAANKHALVPEGVVRLAAPDAFSHYFLPGVLRDLGESYPHLEVQLVPMGRTLSLLKREADVAVMVGQPKSGNLLCKKIADYSLHLYASRNYIARFGTPAHRDDLEQHRLIGFVDDLLSTSSLDYCAEFFGGLRQNLQISSATAQLHTVRAGAGIGILHDFATKPFDDLELVLPELSIHRSYWMSWHNQKPTPVRIQAVLDEITRQARAHKSFLAS